MAVGYPHDLMLMDMHMPELDGVEATRVLRGDGFARPIIALTANASEDAKIQFLKAACTAFVSKPIQKGRLFQTILDSIDLTRIPL